MTCAIIQVTSAEAIYAPNKFSAGQKFWQGNDQGKGIFTRAFALASLGVVPRLLLTRSYLRSYNSGCCAELDETDGPLSNIRSTASSTSKLSTQYHCVLWFGVYGVEILDC